MRAGSSYRPAARRRTALLALLVLPALVMRALVPIGFMLVSDGAGIRIGFCPGEAQPPGALAGASVGEHLAHHHHGGGDHGSPTTAAHPPCLFAVSASPALVPAAPGLAPPSPAATALAAEFPSRVSVPAIARAQSARGPPFPG